jgi:hypothetical protein
MHGLGQTRAGSTADKAVRRLRKDVSRSTGRRKRGIMHLWAFQADRIRIVSHVELA